MRYYNRRVKVYRYTEHILCTIPPVKRLYSRDTLYYTNMKMALRKILYNRNRPFLYRV